MKNQNVMYAIVLIALLQFGSLVFAEDKPWDMLRPVSDSAKSLELPIGILALLISLGMTIVAFLAYRRQHTRRFLFLLGAFGLFSLKWVITIADLFVSPGDFFSRASSAILDVLVLALIFLAIYHKQ